MKNMLITDIKKLYVQSSASTLFVLRIKIGHKENS